MKKSGKKLLSYLLALVLVLGLVPWISLTAKAAEIGIGTTTWHVGDTINLGDKYFYSSYYPDQAAGNTVVEKGYNNEVEVPEPIFDTIDRTWGFKLHDAVVSGISIITYKVIPVSTTIQLSASTGYLSNEIPTGFRIKSGTGVYEDPYQFELVYDAVNVTGVSLDKANATVTVGGNVELKAKVNPDNATNKKVKWSVQGEAVSLYSDQNCSTPVGAEATEALTVYAKGISAGSATVTATGNADSNKSASCEVTVNDAASSDPYSVTITPGSNMTKTAESGAASQTGLSGAMTDVVYTADNGYYFPTDYSVAEVSGIKVTRDSYTQITVSGIPTADAVIALTAPTEKESQTITAGTVEAVYGATNATMNALTDGGGTLSYVVKDGGDVIAVDSTGNITTKKVGTATVTVKAAETATHKAATKDVNVTINKATITITAKDQTMEVGGTVPSISGEDAYTVEGLVPGDKLTAPHLQYQKDGEEVESTKIDKSKTGTYLIVPSDAKADVEKYNDIVYKNGTLTIKEKSTDSDSAPYIPPTPTDMFRLYNPNSGEHFYTGNEGEKDHLVSFGWNFEGIAWTAPAKSNTPVYCLYNPNAGDYHYTMSEAEKDWLVELGWNDEGIGWYSVVTEREPIYRLYNPNATTGTHHFTASEGERDYLISLGWKAEGIGWYGLGEDAA